MQERILVFLTCYNCAPQIPRVLAQFKSEYADLFQEILVIDNRSTDNTREAAIAAAQQMPNYKVTVIQNDENVNLGGSHKVAFNYAAQHGYDYAVILHGDDQGNIADVVPQLRAGRHREVDFLMGARFLPQSKTPGYSWVRILGNYVFNLLYTVMTGKMIYDLGSGLNVFKVSALVDKTYLRFPDRLSFNYYFLIWMVVAKMRFSYFPLVWREEDQISNARLSKLVQALLEIMLDYISAGKKVITQLPLPEIAYSSTILYQHEAKR